MDARSKDQDGTGQGPRPTLVLLDGGPLETGSQRTGRALTRREWKVAPAVTDLGGLPVVTWRTVEREWAPIRRIHRHRGACALRRRIWFGVAAVCLFTLGFAP